MSDWLQNTVFMGQTLLQYAQVLAVLVILFGVLWVLKQIIFRRLQRWADGTSSNADNILIRSAQWPFQIATLCFAILVLTQLLDLPFVAITWLSIAAQLGFILAVIRFLSGACEVVAMSLVHWLNMRDAQLDSQICPLITRSLRVLVWLMGILTILQSLGYSITGIIASLGIGGAALAFASQDTIANVFGSIKVLIDRPFVIGDWIRSTDGNIEGVVEDIRFFSTQLRTFADTVITVPNNKIANLAIENFSRMTRRRVVTQIGLGYQTSVDQLKEIAQGIEAHLKEHPEILQDTIFVRYTEFGESSLNLMLYFFTRTIDWGEWLQIREAIYLTCLGIIEKAEAEVAVPVRELRTKAWPEQSLSLSVNTNGVDK